MSWTTPAPSCSLNCAADSPAIAGRSHPSRVMVIMVGCPRSHMHPTGAPPSHMLSLSGIGLDARLARKNWAICAAAPVFRRATRP